MFQGENLELHVDAHHTELPGRIFRMCGPCNGIFCILHSNDIMGLRSPATKRLFEVPDCPLIQYMRRVIDFGVDPLTGDLKIVVISGIGMIREFAIFNLSNNFWRLLNQNFVQASGYSVVTESNYFCPTFPDGFCYWLKCNEQKSHFVILAFDLHNESFQEIEMPEINLESRVERQLSWFNDSLALSTYQSFDDETRVDIWSMKEHGCWTKVWNFSLPFIKVTSIGVWMRKQIFAMTSDWKLVIYDTESGNTKNLEFRRVEDASNRALFAFVTKNVSFHCECLEFKITRIYLQCAISVLLFAPGEEIERLSA